MLVAGSLLFAACDKKEDAVTENGVVKQVSDAAGCQFVIDLDSRRIIDPINQESDKLKPHLVHNARVSVNYRLDKDFETPCQNATAAEVLEIRRINQ